MMRQLRLLVHFVLFILLVFSPAATVHGFANYLLRPSHCGIPLSTQERIMNAVVVAATESIDPTMRIEVTVASDDALIVHDDPLHTVIRAQERPVYFALRLLSDETKDYQWVMDVMTSDDNVTGVAAVVNGGCAGQRRVTGRGPQAVAQLYSARHGNVTVRAAWASMYGSVTLTRPHTMELVSPTLQPPRMNHKKWRRRIMMLLALLLVMMATLGHAVLHRIIPRQKVDKDGIAKRRS